MSDVYVWGALTAVFLIVEGLTAGLASIWFAIGAACALLAAAFGAPVWLEVVWFILISIVTLVLTRPLAKKLVSTRLQATNADRLLGGLCRVTERVDNLAGTGSAVMDGKT